MCGLRWLSIACQASCVLCPDAFVIADLVVDPTGGVTVRPDRLTKAFERITDRVPGASEVRLYDLRHWYATPQLDAGESLAAVAARIGDPVETLAKVNARRERTRQARSTRQHW